MPGFMLLQPGDVELRDDAVGAGGFSSVIRGVIKNEALVKKYGYSNIAVKFYRCKN